MGNEATKSYIIETFNIYMYVTKCHWDTVTVKEPDYAYSCPNTMWISVFHKYNRDPL